MTGPRLTASGGWRAELCPASCVLPAGPPRRYKDAEDGQDEHRRLEKAAPPGSIPEAKFALNVLSGEARFIGIGSDRAYGPLSEGEIAGTADVLFVNDDHLLMQDYKTGTGYAEQMAGVFDKPKDNLQFGHNALCASLVHDRPFVIFQALYTKLKLPPKECLFDCFDFAAVRQRWLDIWRRCEAAGDLLRNGAQPRDLVSVGLCKDGAACWRCEARTACPIKGRKAA